MKGLILLRIVISILVVCFILLSGCSEEDLKTIEQSIVSENALNVSGKSEDGKLIYQNNIIRD